MAWNIRSLDDASAAVRGAFRRYMPGTDTALKNSFVTIVVKVLAAISYEFELRMGWLSKQILLSTSTSLAWIRLHAAEVGIYQRPAAAAQGEIIGTGQASTTYPSGIRFVSGSVTYVSTLPATSGADGALVITVVAEVKGSVGNRASAGLLSLADPGLFPTLGTVWLVDNDGLGGGADAEDADSLKERGLQRKRNPPGGGTLADYERIAMGVSGVLKAWAFRVPGSPGGIVVHFLFNGREDNIPLPSDVEAVQAVIDQERLIRVDDSIATAPVPRPIDVSITGLSGDTPEIRAAIKNGITAMYLSRCRPGLTGDSFTVSRSWYSEVISGVTGEDRHVLVEPSGDIVLTGGQFPVNGEFDFGS
ncbi:baseplate J/gp47 family protein [Agrobacterium tumefaciens]|uniref:baseplate J/gp47 family protein n=1 Tax=Agrobacterium tumefaciens TaxID=358 RepID=UPI00157166A6|nr:baseplate J/gp47 family protein [Agrobacterium tumefaciens]WCK12336.1 baseplate J/gp47 family protein [Agrobacterium tumefaciens]